MKKIDDRRSRIEDCGGRALRSSIFYLLSSILFLSAGCTYESSSQGPERQTLEQRQDAAIRDPIKNNYEDNVRPYDISGGGINNLDRGALDRDLKHVFGP